MDDALGDTLLLAVTGSVGASLMPQFVLHVRRDGLFRRVRVMLSYAAQRFVTPYTMELHAGGPVFTDTFGTAEDVVVPHIDLPREADALLVMPATANVLGKAANGICDDLVTSAIVACEAPVVFVPSMNHAMWVNPAVKRNVGLLRELGHTVVDPDVGYEISDVARGSFTEVYGVMAPRERVFAELRKALARPPGR